jgi:hypothetical protein
MRRRSKGMFDRTERLPGAAPAIVMIFGNPEVGRLQWRGRIPAGAMQSEREAVIGEEHFEAEPGESIRHFHARICDIARERGVRIISIGSAPSPAPPRPPGRPEGVTIN